MTPAVRTTYIVLFVVFLGLSCPLFTCASWCLYDGTVKYPDQKERYDAYVQVYQSHTDPVEAAQEWEALAVQKGWPTDIPQQKDDKDILTQKILSGFFGIICSISAITAFVFGFLLWRGRTQNPAA